MSEPTRERIAEIIRAYDEGWEENTASWDEEAALARLALRLEAEVARERRETRQRAWERDGARKEIVELRAEVARLRERIAKLESILRGIVAARSLVSIVNAEPHHDGIYRLDALIIEAETALAPAEEPADEWCGTCGGAGWVSVPRYEFDGVNSCGGIETRHCPDCHDCFGGEG